METPSAKALGKRLFIAGSISLLLFSTVHMIPMFIDLFIEPSKPLEVEAKRAMRAVAVDIGPFHSDWAKLTQLLSVSYSALLFFVVALNLVALPAVVAAGGGRLRAMAAVNVIFTAILLGTSIAFQFPPPGVFALVALVFFFTAMVKATPRPTA